MDEETVKKPVDRSRRAAVVASIVAIVLVALAVVVALNWGELQLRYHRHYFRNGTTAEQVVALWWMCEHRLRKGMTAKEVEAVLGEPLKNSLLRFDRRETKGHSSWGFGPQGSFLVTLDFQDDKLKRWEREIFRRGR